MSSLATVGGLDGMLAGFGIHRLKMVLELGRYPELDERDWKGQVFFHCGDDSIKAAVHPAAHEIEP